MRGCTDRGVASQGGPAVRDPGLGSETCAGRETRGRLAHLIFGDSCPARSLRAIARPSPCARLSVGFKGDRAVAAIVPPVIDQHVDTHRGA